MLSLHFRKISLHFPEMQGETSSHSAAFTTTHSHANRDFPWFDEYPAVLRGRKAGLAVSAGKKDRFRGSSGPSSLASKNRFPGAWEGAARDSVRMRQRPVCSQEFREELGHDGHAIVDAHAIAGLPLESVRAAAFQGSSCNRSGKPHVLQQFPQVPLGL